MSVRQSRMRYWYQSDSNGDNALRRRIEMLQSIAASGEWIQSDSRARTLANINPARRLDYREMRQCNIKLTTIIILLYSMQCYNIILIYRVVQSLLNLSIFFLYLSLSSFVKICTLRQEFPLSRQS